MFGVRQYGMCWNNLAVLPSHWPAARQNRK
jgi:hypothetical protein